MLRTRSLAAGCWAVALVVSALSCGPQTTAQASLALSASPHQIAPDGTTTTLSIAATDAQGKPGTGTVTLSAPEGSFDATSLTLESGTATATWSCDVAKSSFCTGTVAITAEWNGATARTNVALSSPDAGGGAGAEQFDADGLPLCTLPKGMFGDNDAVHVFGTAGVLGMVNYTSEGAGGFGPSGDTGLERYTDKAGGFSGGPSGIKETRVYAWSDAPIIPNNVYVTDNTRAMLGDPYVDFSITWFDPTKGDTDIVCAHGDGHGRFVYRKFASPLSPMTPAEGAFEFQCPAAGIDVRGCFHYE